MSSDSVRTSGRECINELRQVAPLILPSLLLCDFANLQSEIERLEEAGVAGLHLDVMDGVFVPNFTYGMTIVDALRKITDLPLDVHLMMVDPDKYIEQFQQAGADIITIHAESVEDPIPVLDQIRSLGCAAGLAINPATPVCGVESAIEHCDMVLCMSVQPGFGGQSFDESVLEKFNQIRELAAGADVLLQIDGGINVSTIEAAVGAGAQLLVAGSAIFKQPDYAIAIQQLMAKVQ